ncbi:MAG: bifunctional phosphopantothenoylcysteine decarboxylase/phosphopantothenate--cysteine ligase CoaBC, partial [Firmicutes bacterium]|nr:bifunctional phosphopantothenoylcysteine decarboxylase/phosphopantothenate--cysteine ligase CoaBC [Bacillota bacterium]
EKIFEIVSQFFSKKKKWLGKKAVVTAGPTYEPIDPVRFIGNHSSGLMGFSIAEQLAAQGAEVTLITGPTAMKTANQSICRIDVVTAKEMFEKTLQYSSKVELIVMAAAVADYTPKTVAAEKIKKNNSEWELPLQKTTDILYELGKIKPKNQCIVGFALETENEIENAVKKLHKKNIDFIVLNSLKNKGAGFKTETNQVTLFAKNGSVFAGECKPKSEVAVEILDFIYESMALTKCRHIALKKATR